jgi:HD-like signal output (HDOD) protein
LSEEEGALPTEDEVATRLEQAVTRKGCQPPLLPAVTVELMALAGRPEVEVDEVVKLLEKDTLLAGRVLQIARSPLDAPAMELRSLKAAIVRLGLNAIRIIVMEVSMSTRVFKAPVYADALAHIQVHSKAVAYLARLVARQTFIDPEFAFLCGLLHDVGLSVSLVTMADPVVNQPPPALETLCPALDVLHETVAGLMADHWKLPAQLKLVIEWHHGLTSGGLENPVAAIVTLADELAVSHGRGPQPNQSAALHVVDAPDERRRRRALDALVLRDCRLEIEPIQRLRGLPAASRRAITSAAANQAPPRPGRAPRKTHGAASRATPLPKSPLGLLQSRKASSSSGRARKRFAPAASSSSRPRKPHSAAIPTMPAFFAVATSTGVSPTKPIRSGGTSSVRASSSAAVGSGLRGTPSRSPRTATKGQRPNRWLTKCLVKSSRLLDRTAIFLRRATTPSSIASTPGYSVEAWCSSFAYSAR